MYYLNYPDLTQKKSVKAISGSVKDLIRACHNLRTASLKATI